MIYIGIDPGQKGSMAVIRNSVPEIYKYEEGRYIEVLSEIAASGNEIVCCLEHVSAMPGNGSVSMFNFGCNFGWVQGVLQALRIPYELVRPQKWKKEFSVTKDKNTALAVCKRLFPEISLLPNPRCRKESADSAEALLMAEYARRNL